MPEVEPVASFENTRFHGANPQNSGPVGNQSEHTDRVDRVQTIQTNKAGEGAHLSDDGPDQEGLQPKGGKAGPNTRSAFYTATHTQETVITDAKANHEIQHTAGSAPK